MNSIAVINVCSDGSTGKIALGLHDYLLSRGYNSSFWFRKGPLPVQGNCYRFGSRIDTYFHALMTRLTGKQGSFSIWTTKRLVNSLKKKNIDTIYAISLHGYYLNERILFNYAAKQHVDFVYIMIDWYPFLGKCCYNRGCTNYTKGCGSCPNLREYPKSYVDKSAILFKEKNKNYNKVTNIIFVGPQIAVENARLSPIMKSRRLEIIDEAIDVGFYHPVNTSELRNKLGLSEEKIICVCVGLYTGDLNHTKGVRYFIDLARSLEEYDSYVFVHVGYIAKDKEGLPSNYVAIGYVKDQYELIKYYSLGDLFVFPTIEDSMPNTCIEAIACGTPLLCFDISGMSYMAPDGIATFVKACDVDEMKRVVLNTPKKNKEIISRCREYAIKRYDNRLYYERLLNLVKSNDCL